MPNFSKICPARDYCDLIDCWLCWKLLSRPQCKPLTALAIYSSFIYIVGSIVFSILFLTRFGRKICNFDLAGLRIRKNRYRQLKEQEEIFLEELARGSNFDLESNPSEIAENAVFHRHSHPTTNSNWSDFEASRVSPRKGRRIGPTTCIIACLLLAVPALSQDISIFQAKEEMCLEKNHELHCTLMESAIVTISSLQQEAVFPIKDFTGKISSELKLKTEGLRFICKPISIFFTRDFKLHTDSIFRCSGYGSCIDTFCDKLKPNGKISELEGIANDYPGYSYCDQSCGGLFCGCPPWSGKGCLLFRTYALPTSDETIYEVFSCDWVQTLPTYIFYKAENNSFEHKFMLEPGKTQTFNHIKLTLILTIKPEITGILNSHFSTNSRKFVVLLSEEFEQSKHLRCSDRKAAKIFNCTFFEDLCKCRPALTTENCHLPLETLTYSIYGDHKEIELKYSDFSSVQIQIRLEGYKIVSKIVQTKCSVKASKAVGCYRCRDGATIPYTCKTEVEASLVAEVTCEGGLRFNLLCDSSQKLRRKRVSIDKLYPQLNCTIECPIPSKFSLDLDGLLFVLESEYGQRSGSQSAEHYQVTLIDWDAVFRWLTAEWTHILIVGLVIVAAFVLPFPFIFMACPGLFFALCARRAQMPKPKIKNF